VFTLFFVPHLAISCTPTYWANSDHSDPGTIMGSTDQTVYVTCNIGYAPGSSMPVVCQANGSFDTGALVTCSANACAPTQVANSNKASAGAITGVFGTQVTVTCNAGYSGSGVATCGASGAFSSVSCTGSKNLYSLG
jgi:hypothetical protein